MCRGECGTKRSRGARAGHGGAELLGLHHGAVCEVGAGDPCRKAEVVLDAGAVAGLAPDGDGFEAKCGESLGGAVHGGSEAPRPAAYDDEVEAPVREVGNGEAEKLGEFTGCRAAEKRTGGDDDREVVRFDLELA